jgi:hypothetical protein
MVQQRPFIGSEALASGALNRYELRRYYRAVMPNVYLDRRVRPALRQRTVAAWLWSRRQAVVAGLAASAWHGAQWVDDDSPVELIWGNGRSPRGVVTRHELLLDDEFQTLGGLLVTTPERTAFDHARPCRRGRPVAKGNMVAALADSFRLPATEDADSGAEP